MATQDDVRRIAARLPGAVEGEEGFGFSVPVKGKHKGFAWRWMERVEPKKARVPNEGVLAIVVRNLTEKEILLGSGNPAIFTEPHYNGFPAVLVRLADIELDLLEEMLEEAWRCKAPPDIVRQFDAATSR